MKNLFIAVTLLFCCLIVKFSSVANTYAQPSHGVVTLTDATLLSTANPVDKSIIFVIAVAGADKQRSYKWVSGAMPTTPTARVSYMTYNKFWIQSSIGNGYWAMSNMDIAAENVVGFDSLATSLGFIKTAPAAPVASVYRRVGAITAATNDYNTSQVSEGTNLYYTPARARTSISALSNGGVTYNSSTGEISQSAPSYNNAPGRALTTAFRPSLTRPTRLSYTVSIATTLSLLNLNSSGTVALQISPDGTNWSSINSAGITRTLAVSISVGLNDTSLLNVSGEAPAGYYVRILPTTSGGAVVTMNSGQEVIY